MVFKFSYVLYFLICYFYKMYENSLLIFFLLDLYIFYIYLCKLNSLFKYLKILKNIKYEFVDTFMDFRINVLFLNISMAKIWTYRHRYISEKTIIDIKYNIFYKNNMTYVRNMGP